MERKSADKRRLERIYAATQHGGRRMPAVISDAVFMLAALFFVLCPVFRPHTESRLVSRTAAFICTVFAGLFWVLTDAALRKRHTAKLRKTAAREAAERKLLLYPEELYRRIPQKPGSVVIEKVDALTADDIAGAAKGGAPVTLITLAKPTERAKELLGMLEGEVTVMDALEAAGVKAEELFPVTEAEIDAQIVHKYSKLVRPPSIKAGLFSLTRERALKYLAVGAALTAMSFFIRYPLYYRAVGSVLLSVGGWVFVSEKLKAAKGNEPAA